MGSLTGKRVCVVVLGDFGRSPRMMYHASSLLACGANVVLVGYRGTPLIDELRRADQRLFEPFDWPRARATHYVLFAVLKLLATIFKLSWVMMSVGRPDAILVQNPPSAALPVVIAFAALRGCRVVVDWHNLGFTTLALALGCAPSISDDKRNSALHQKPWIGGVRLVQLCRWAEAVCARQASAHLAVTDGMASWLRHSFQIESARFHDSPPESFRPMGPAEQHDLFMRLRSE